MKTEITFAMIKPGAFNRRLIGEITSRFERKGFNIVGMKVIKVSEKQAEMHYAEHVDKPFFNELVTYIQSSPSVVFALEGENAVQLVRKMAGDTDPLQAQLGTIRGDYSSDITNNVIHTSDSLETAKRELAIYFTNEELVYGDPALERWTFEFCEEKND